MFYKVVYNGKVIDVLDNLVRLKYQEKHDRMVLCGEDGAQATISSDGNYIWHVEGWYDIPVDRYETVSLHAIDEFEYNRLKALELGTKEDVMDEFVRLLIVGDSSLLVDSMKRLYSRQEIDKDAVIKFCNILGVAEDDKSSILK